MSTTSPFLPELPDSIIWVQKVNRHWWNVYGKDDDIPFQLNTSDIRLFRALESYTSNQDQLLAKTMDPIRVHSCIIQDFLLLGRRNIPMEQLITHLISFPLERQSDILLCAVVNGWTDYEVLFTHLNPISSNRVVGMLRNPTDLLPIRFSDLFHEFDKVLLMKIHNKRLFNHFINNPEIDLRIRAVIKCDLISSEAEIEFVKLLLTQRTDLEVHFIKTNIYCLKKLSSFGLLNKFKDRIWITVDGDLGDFFCEPKMEYQKSTTIQEPFQKSGTQELFFLLLTFPQAHFVIDTSMELLNRAIKVVHVHTKKSLFNLFGDRFIIKHLVIDSNYECETDSEIEFLVHVSQLKGHVVEIEHVEVFGTEKFNRSFLSLENGKGLEPLKTNLVINRLSITIRELFSRKIQKLDGFKVIFPTIVKSLYFRDLEMGWLGNESQELKLINTFLSSLSSRNRNQVYFDVFIGREERSSLEITKGFSFKAVQIDNFRAFDFLSLDNLSELKLFKLAYPTIKSILCSSNAQRWLDEFPNSLDFLPTFSSVRLVLGKGPVKFSKFVQSFINSLMISQIELEDGGRVLKFVVASKVSQSSLSQAEVWDTVSFLLDELKQEETLRGLEGSERKNASVLALKEAIGKDITIIEQA